MAAELNILDKHLRCRDLLSKGLYINHGLPPGVYEFKSMRAIMSWE